MICDYYLLTNGNIFIDHLYDGAKTNKHYYYHKGWNVQAYIAYIAGVAVPFPGETPKYVFYVIRLTM